MIGTYSVHNTHTTYLYVNTTWNVKLSTSIFVHKSSSMLQCGSFSIFLSHGPTHVSRAQLNLFALQLEIRRHLVRAHINYIAVIHRPQSTSAIIILSAQHRKLMIILLFSRVFSLTPSLSLSLTLSFALRPVPCYSNIKYFLYAL